VQRSLILPMSLFVLSACGRDPNAMADTAGGETARVSNVGLTQRDSAAGFVVATAPARHGFRGEGWREAGLRGCRAAARRDDGAGTPEA
jgi:hypothetical protein